MIEQTEKRELSPIEQLGEARGIVAKMTRLADNGDYKYLHNLMQENLDLTVASSFSAPKGLDDVVKNIYTQGEVAGFSRAMSFLSLLINGAKETIAHLEYLEKETE